VELPAPASAIQFAALLDGKRLGWRADGEPGALATGVPGARTVRLRIDPPGAGGGPQVLELFYVLGPGRSDPGRGSRWQLTLVPPRLHGPVFVGPWRWQVGVASGDLLLATGDDTEFD